MIIKVISRPIPNDIVVLSELEHHQGDNSQHDTDTAQQLGFGFLNIQHSQLDQEASK